MAGLTREQKRRLAGNLTSAAAEMAYSFVTNYGPEDRSGIYDEDPEVVAFDRAVRETLARWLRDLPGDEWDRRLPDPSTLR